MKKEDLLAMGLTEEQADKVMDGLNGDFVTKSRFNEVNTELKAARTALSERDKQLEELKKVDAAALQAQITQLQADNKQKDADYAAQLKALKISNAVELALTGAKAKNNTAAKALPAVLLFFDHRQRRHRGGGQPERQAVHLLGAGHPAGRPHRRPAAR